MASQYPEIQAALEDGEAVLWEGQPKQGLVLRAIDYAWIVNAAILALVMQGSREKIIEIFERHHPGNGDTLQMGLMMHNVQIAFVICFCLYAFFLRHWWDARRRKHTFYALTRKQLILISREGKKSFLLPQISELSVQKHQHGYGTIFIGKRPSRIKAYFLHSYSFWGGRPLGVCLERVENAQDVYKLIQAGRNNPWHTMKS